MKAPLFLFLLLSVFSLSLANDKFPDFSWDKVPYYMHFSKLLDTFTDEEIDFIASRSSFVCIEKSHNFRKTGDMRPSLKLDAERLRAKNPNIKILAYLSLTTDYPFYKIELPENSPNWIKKNDEFVTSHHGDFRRFDLSKADIRIRLLELAKELMTTYGCDGIFLDEMGLSKASRLESWYKFSPEHAQAAEQGLHSLMNDIKQFGKDNNKIIIFNGIFSRLNKKSKQLEVEGSELLPGMDGAMLEHFNHFASMSPAAIASDIEQIKIIAEQNKIGLVKGMPESFDWVSPDILKQHTPEELAQIARDELGFTLACFLVAAQKNSYFNYSWGYHIVGKNDYGNLKWYEEFDKKLGKPLSDAVVEGFLYKRSFEYCNVWVDLKKHSYEIIWLDKKQSRPSAAKDKTNAFSKFINKLFGTE